MFELAFPWIFLLIPVPFIVYFLLPKIRLSISMALKVPFFAALSPLIHERKDIMKKESLIYPLIIWFLLLVAISGPRWVGDPMPIKREGYNIMLALDLSESMEIPDMMIQDRPVSRLFVVKQAAQAFVKARTADQLGLILFGTQAYLQTPFTYDRKNILLRLQDATAGLAGKTTSIGDAIGLAVKRFQDTPVKGRILILLTDGVNNSGVLKPLKAAELAKTDNIRIYTIGLGSNADPRALAAGFILPNTFSELDEDTLKKVAEMTNGQYFRATDPQSLYDIYQTINNLERIEQLETNIRPQKEYYPWVLAFSVFLMFFWIFANTQSLRGFWRKPS